LFIRVRDPKHFGRRRLLPRDIFVIGAADVDLMNGGMLPDRNNNMRRVLNFRKSAIAVRSDDRSRAAQISARTKPRRGHMTKLNKKTEAILLAAQLVNVLKGIALNPESEDADKLRGVELILHLMDDVPALLDKLSETETQEKSPEAETSEE
jgi:hypothetical protein